MADKPLVRPRFRLLGTLARACGSGWRNGMAAESARA
jgi:hypothetical protein